MGITKPGQVSMWAIESGPELQNKQELLECLRPPNLVEVVQAFVKHLMAPMEKWLEAWDNDSWRAWSCSRETEVWKYLRSQALTLGRILEEKVPMRPTCFNNL